MLSGGFALSRSASSERAAGSRFILDANQAGRVLGLLLRLRENQRDRLAVPVNLRILQHQQRASGSAFRKQRRRGELRRVLMRQHQQHARRGLGLTRIDGHDAPLRNRC